MTPLDPKTEYEIVVFTGDGRVHPQEPRPATFGDIYRASAEHRGAVAHDREGSRFLVFDLHHAAISTAGVIPGRWWAFISKEQAIAHALWLLRGEAEALGLGGEPEPSEKPASNKKSVAAMGLPDVADKIMTRSYQRSGVVAGGTLLSSCARQATLTFTPTTFRRLKLAADKNGVSLSEMVRHCVDRVLGYEVNVR